MDELSSEQFEQDERLEPFYVWQNLQSALGSLYHARRSIKGREMVPEADVARRWLLITGIYSLLEQSLKFLRQLEDTDYDGQKMRQDSHDLYAVYRNLSKEHKRVLRLYFEEYASLMEVTWQGGLDQYLEEKGSRRRYERWRYFLIERDWAQLDQGQTNPLHTDLMLEIIHGVLDLIISHINQQVVIESVSRRLERELRLAPYGASDSNEAEVAAWRKDNPCLINACSRWLRVGPLEHYSSPFMRDWVGRTMGKAVDVDTRLDMAIGRNSKLGIAYDMAIFKRRAERSWLTWDGERFVSRNPLPEPVDKIMLQGKWSVEWNVAQSLWTGRMRRALTEVPTRVGQCAFIEIDGALQDEDGNSVDPDGLLSSGVGHLVVKMDGKQVVEMTATPLSVSRVGWGEPNDAPRDYSITFVKTDNNGEWPDGIHNDFRCIACHGTGFCPECLGENKDDACKCTGGLCRDCKGYGEDGQHLLAQVAST